MALIDLHHQFTQLNQGRIIQSTQDFSWPATVSIQPMVGEHRTTALIVELSFDTYFDHAMESVRMGHPEDAMPFCVRHYRLRDGGGKILHECAENHATRNTIELNPPVATSRLTLELLSNHSPSTSPAPLGLFEIRCYAPE